MSGPLRKLEILLKNMKFRHTCFFQLELNYRYSGFILLLVDRKASF